MIDALAGVKEGKRRGRVYIRAPKDLSTILPPSYYTVTYRLPAPLLFCAVLC